MPKEVKPTAEELKKLKEEGKIAEITDDGQLDIAAKFKVKKQKEEKK